MVGPYDAHQGAAQETESRYPTPVEDPPLKFRREQMWVVLGIVGVAVLGWLAYVLTH